MKNHEKYLKTNRKGRKAYVSSINLEFYQHKILKEKGINLSLLVRDLLESYLSGLYPDRYKVLKEFYENGEKDNKGDEL